MGTAFVDVNGDGLPDIVRGIDTEDNTATHPSQNVSSAIWLNTGSGWQLSTLKLPVFLAMYPDQYGRVFNFHESGVRFADVNGDGLVDVIRSFKEENGAQHPDYDENSVYLNQGDGTWATTTDWEMPKRYGAIPIIFTNPDNPSVTAGYNIADLNGDRLPEIVRSQVHNNPVKEYYLNIGNGWSEETYSLPFNLTQGYRAYSAGKALIDFDGDTIVDAWNLQFSGHITNQVSGGDARINTNDLPDIVVEVTEPEGGITTIDYDGYLATVQSTYSKIGTSTANPVVVTQTIADNGFGNTVTETFAYQDDHKYFDETDVRDRRFAGFGQVTKTTDLGKEITWYHQANGDDNASGETGDEEALIGRAYRTEITDLSDNLFTHSQTDYDTHDLGNGSTFVKLASEVILDYDGDSDEKARATSYTYSNTHGSVLSVTQHGEVNASSDGTWSDTGSDDRSTTYTYATGGDLVLPATETLKDDSNTTVAETRFYYDNQALGSVTTGNLTKQEAWISGGSYADQTFTHDTYGNVLTETDGEGNVTTYGYDSFNLHPTTITNDLSQATSYEYDYRTGQVATTTDVNGHVFVTTYDGFGRPTSETIPDPQTGSPVTKTAWTYTDTAGAVSVTQINHLTSVLSTDAITYLDGFGNVIQERQEGEGDYAVRDFSYGDNGLLETESLPYFSAGSARTTATTNTDLLSTYTYDALGRVTNVATVVGNTGTSYDQWEETVTDTAGTDKDFTYDAYGRLVTVTEHEGSNTFDTDYGYDSRDNLTKITDALGHERGIAYDGLSRRTSLEDLHDPSDTTFGTWTFSYDDASNLTSQTDPNGQTINWAYDDLNRQLTEDYTGAAGTEITYTYDSCTNGVGQLCSAANTDVTTAYTYTDNNLVESESKTIDSTTYTTNYDYDRQGNQTELTYPNGDVVRYTHNAAGAVETVEEKENGGSFTDLIVDIDYGPHGKETYIERASGIASTYTFDAGELYRLRSIDTGPGSGGPGAELQALEAELFATEVVETPVVPEVIEEPEVPPAQASSTKIEEAPEPAVSTTTEPAEVPVETEPIASSTTAIEAPAVIFDLATSSPTTTSSVLDTAIKTTTDKRVTKPTEITTTVNDRALRLAGKKPQIELKLENSQQARVLQKYHRERVEGMKALGMEGTKAYRAAMHGYDQAELALTKDRYIEMPGAPVHSAAREWATMEAKKLGKTLQEIVRPAEAGAYLFNTEDFESCSTLPCSFDNLSTWGGVTASIDSGSQVEGTKSLKEVVTGSGSGALELTDQNEDEIYVQFKVYVPSNMTWGASGYYSLLRLEDVADGTVFSMALEDWGDARLTINGDVLPWTNTGVNLTKGAVNTVEVRFKKGATDGAVDIWVDNTTAGSPDYSSGNVNTGTDNVDDIHVGVTYSPEAVSTTYYDDAVFDTAFIGDTSGGGGGPLPGEATTFTQDLTYTYDNVGNITKIVDVSDSFSEGTTDYTYDDLNRLTNATMSFGAAGNFNRSYTYNEIGNITNKHGTAYTYDGLGAGGSSGSSYTLYDDAIASGWADWSWNSTNNPSDTSPVSNGSYSLEATYSASWGSLALYNSSIDLSAYDDLTFELNVGNNTGTELYLYFRENAWPDPILGGPVLLSQHLGGFQANTWQTVTVPLSTLGIDGHNSSLQFTIEAAAPTTINVDDIKFVGSGGGIGSSATNANPHAATNIGGTTYTYDDNGNVLTNSAGLQNTWNYRNELIESGDGTATTTFVYDHTGQRIKKTSPTNTATYYPFSHYEVRDGDVSTHIYLGGRLAATREDGTIIDVHTDHLGSTHTVTNEHARLEQVLGYYPYGEERTNGTFGTTENNNRYTGYDHDEETGLNYAGARYQSGPEARFTSQDPVALKIGDWGDMNADAAIPLPDYFRDPQRFNTYAYAGNNPIKNVDLTGKDYGEVALAGFVGAWGGSIGLRFDPSKGRLDVVGSSVYGGGGSAELSATYNSGELPSEPHYVTTGAEFTVQTPVPGLVVKGGADVAMSTNNPGAYEESINIGAGLGAGLSAGGGSTLGVRLFDLSSGENIFSDVWNYVRSVPADLQQSQRTIDDKVNSDDYSE
ncbi:RHS repeat-associated core domain-containing protein [Roseovarius rhodophyticola]|uniref:RHS repeat-associated core domain-containing protein n=1 Tax=Roseovarius rhodophyticola TaxID=3080827 RepID=A0ABZ2TJC6_9RHOB